MNEISITAKISPLCDIETSCKGSKLIIGENSMIDSFVKIKFAGGLGNVIIGENTYINSGTVIYSGNGVIIGNDVLIAANCTLAPVNHNYKAKSILIRIQSFAESKGGIIIENDVWIGANVTILDGSHIKKGAVIGANSLVNGIVEEYTVSSGNPLVLKGKRK
jgi:virginiamycin A acetyltransferase